MKFELDEITLAEMTKEARQCFLDEDAPEYICVLNTEIEKGYENANFTELLRAAHSLKGGAGIAQLFSIMELSHSFEDIVAIIQKLPNSRTEEAWVLLEFIVNEITILLHQAEGDEEIFVDAKLLKKLADFIDSYSATATNIIPEKKPQNIEVKSEPEPVNNSINSANYQEDSLSSSNLRISLERLELDRYTEIHISLQTFQELMLQFQENYADLKFINQDVSDNLDGLETNVDSLYGNVTQSRLVPFRTIGQRFLPQVQSLAYRCNKSVNLLIEGEEVLIDKILLEQLQTPLSHLINNALSHGIELPSERLAHHKPEQANIKL